MNLLKLTLLFCLFTSALLGQQEYPGYVVKLEGDTLRGRIIVMPHVIKFLHENVKYKYQREELKDYGYYGNRSYFSRPDVAPPAPKSNIIGSLVLATGDTLTDFHVQYKSPEHIIGYFEYPKYLVYEAAKAELLELITHDQGEGDISTDLIFVDNYPKTGDVLPMYTPRIVNKGLQAYNVNCARPYIVIYDRPTVYLPFSKGAIAGAALQTLLSAALHDGSRRTEANADRHDWIIYKGDKTYYIKTYREWKKQFATIFEEDAGFEKYLKSKNINNDEVEAVLKAYGDFI